MTAYLDLSPLAEGWDKEILYPLFLFILGSEVFSRLMFKDESLGSLQGLQITRNCSAVHHLLFTDDLPIFGKATVIVVATIKSCLEKYCRWSG
jgi:hypothetical protein